MKKQIIKNIRKMADNCLMCLRKWIFSGFNKEEAAPMAGAASKNQQKTLSSSSALLHFLFAVMRFRES
ncbi:hypothetical protein [Muricauda sp. MAR_2010_75]|uniref:hypothetical protein n=1 Tax=Allomuricauda sp. MAR_2010_75 TaxID=1250232 RepID=UPI0012E00A60|nr:hypothetical protein [Muricauda sp. MAR_2010_75]